MKAFLTNSSASGAMAWGFNSGAGGALAYLMLRHIALPIATVALLVMFAGAALGIVGFVGVMVKAAQQAHELTRGR